MTEPRKSKHTFDDDLQRTRPSPAGKILAEIRPWLHVNVLKSLDDMLNASNVFYLFVDLRETFVNLRVKKTLLKLQVLGIAHSPPLNP